MSKFLTLPIQTPRNWENYEYHPMSELTDISEGVDVGKIADHMREFGYDESEPIILFENKILVGRTRHAAAKMAEIVDPPFRLLKGNDPWPIVVKDLLRRHLTPIQKGLAATKLAGFPRPAKNGPEIDDDQKTQENDGETKLPAGSLVGFNPMTRVEAAAIVGTSVRTLDRATVIKEKGIPVLQRLARTGKVSGEDAEKVALMPKKVQEKACQKFALGKAKTLAEAAGIKDKKPKKKARPGDAKFDWKKFEAVWADFTRMLMDDLPAAYTTEKADEKKSLQGREAIRLHTELGNVIALWKERLNRGT